MNLARLPQVMIERTDVVHVGSDFWEDQADSQFVDTVTDSGTVAMGDDVNGVATLTPSDGTVADNDEAYLASPNEVFKFGTNRSIYGRAKLRFTEVTATIANVAFGFQNAVGANSLVDDGAGPKTSGSTLAIFKVDGGAVWKCTSACNGTATTSTSTTAAVAATDYLLEIICNDWDGVSMEVSFKVDGSYLKDSSNNIIKHTVAIASATEMQMWAGIKLGAITNNDTLLVDYMDGVQTRI